MRALKNKMKEVKVASNRLLVLHKAFSKHSPSKIKTVKDLDNWKKKVVVMEHEASEAWYRLAQAISEAEKIGVEVVSKISKEKKNIDDAQNVLKKE
ncbi:hypothetical protein ACFL96_11150 [Thermoproteota archaeon]